MFVDKTLEIKMKKAPRVLAFAVSLSSVLCSVSTLCAQAAKPEVGCSPVSLELVVGENGETGEQRQLRALLPERRELKPNTTPRTTRPQTPTRAEPFFILISKVLSTNIYSFS